MSLEQILTEIRSFAGLLELAPLPGSDFPQVSWGDHYFYYAPDGEVPRIRQPYATIVTKNSPGDTESLLDDDDRWRLNIHVGSSAFAELLGYPPERIERAEVDYRVTDVFVPHPLYGTSGWVCIVNPGNATTGRALEALRASHRADRLRVERRQGRSGAPRSTGV